MRKSLDLTEVRVAAVVCCPVCGARVPLGRDGMPVTHWAAPGVPIKCAGCKPTPVWLIAKSFVG